jgi:threonine synthase
MTMNYVSTRGEAPVLTFDQVLLQGLASDGGLYLPEQLPQWDKETLRAWRKLSYADLAVEVMWPFVEGTIERPIFQQLVSETYASFRHLAIAPLIQLETNLWVQELFHGPTLAFKDFALQLLGRLLDHYLEEKDQRVIILGATSGDTGSAAIQGCRHSSRVQMVILHPHNRVSEVQRLQMTTVDADNVLNLAVEGDFDDCQNLVKTLFSDQTFLPEGLQLAAVNSINWARIMAQIVYYVYAAFRMGAPWQRSSFSVPTGNFGDIYAGYLAKQMGLPIDKLIIATNANDLLYRTLKTGRYEKAELKQTLAPSMDIAVSSNFERLLLNLYGDSHSVKQCMNDLKINGAFELSEEALECFREDFVSARSSDEAVLEQMRFTYEESGYLLDPHTATGVRAAKRKAEQTHPLVVLATAHPAKFEKAIESAGLKDALTTDLVDSLRSKKERYQVVENQLDAVKAAVLNQSSVFLSQE